MRIETHPEKYAYELPSLCSHILKMTSLPPQKYVFSADFLARGYRLDRPASKKVWRMICNPEEAVFEDFATVIFVNNPDMGGKGEEIEIWKSVVQTTESYPFDIDTLKIMKLPKNKEKEQIQNCKFLPVFKKYIIKIIFWLPTRHFILPT